MSQVAVEVPFDAFDAVSSEEAQELIAELGDAGVHAQVEYVEGRGALDVAAVVALVTLASTAAAGLAVVVAFLHRVFEVGVVVDSTTSPVKITKDKSLQRGSVLMIPRYGEPVLTKDVSGGDLRDLMARALRVPGQD